MSFESVDSKLFFSRQDSRDPRLGDLTKAPPPIASLEEMAEFTREVAQTTSPGVRNVVLVGYPDDEGIRINGGRLGAALAPDEVRRWLYRMTPSLIGDNGFQIWDAGNLAVAKLALADRHRFVSESAFVALSEGIDCWIGVGGGHDYGFADAAGFIQWAKAQGHRPLIINFDAHLDVRPTNHGLSSGTPFFRVLETYRDIDFAEIGIQAQCNSRSHLEWVKAKGARVLTQEQVEASGLPLVTVVTDLLSEWLIRPRPVFVSVDIDAFSSSVAPGCSQSWATGFMPSDFFPLLSMLGGRLDVKALGLYEVSPPLDHDGRTAKLAAQIIHRVLGMSARGGADV